MPYGQSSMVYFDPPIKEIIIFQHIKIKCSHICILKFTTMTISEAQQRVDEWISTTGVRYFSELTNMAILTEEVGEVARIISRKYGDQSFKESDKAIDLADEIADVLWVLICLANQTGIDLTKAFEKNIQKKTKRDSERHQSNPKLTK